MQTLPPHSAGISFSGSTQFFVRRNAHCYGLALRCLVFIFWSIISISAETPSRSQGFKPFPLPAFERVAVGRFEAFESNGSTLVEWDTTREFRLMAFRLERLDGNQWILVENTPLPALNDFTGGSYRTVDDVLPGSKPCRYRLSACLDDGSNVLIADQFLAVLEKKEVAGSDSQSRRGAPSIFRQPPSRVLTPKNSAAPVNLPASDLAVRIETSTNGIHFISSVSLAPLLGQSDPTVVQSWLRDGSVSLSNGGLPVTYIPAMGVDAATGVPSDGFYFYAELNRNIYTTENVYWLRAGTNGFTSMDGGHPTPVPSGSYRAQFNNEWDDPAYSVLSYATDPEADFWMWKYLLFGGPPRNATATFNVVVDYRAPGDGALQINFHGGSQQTHLVKVTLNDNVFAIQPTWEGAVPYQVQFSSIPSTWWVNGTNVIKVTALGASGVALDSFYVNSFQLTYPRLFMAVNGGLECNAGGNTTVTAGGFTSPSVVIFDISERRHPQWVSNVTVGSTSTGHWEASFRPMTVSNYYVLVQTDQRGAALAPVSLSLASPTALRDSATRASYVVLAPAGLASAVPPLTTLRGTHFRAKTVLLEDVFQEFADGKVTPHAIQDFVKWAYEHWALPPRYLVLVGDGTYDYRNLKGFGDNLLPPRLVSTDYGLFSSDSIYGDVAGDAQPRVAVGRFPIHQTSELAVLVGKIQQYESEVFPSLKALLVADQSPDPNGAGDFVANIGRVQTYLGSRFTSTQIYPRPYPAGTPTPSIDYPSIQAAVQAAVNDGVDVMTYVGHGSYSSLGSGAGYLNVLQPPPGTVSPALKNTHRLPIVTAMTCVAGQYSNPGFASLMEGLVMQSSGGAIATVAPTGLSHDQDAALINRQLMEQFGANHFGRLGDLVIQSLSLYTRAGPGTSTSLWIYNILGDPALQVFSP